MKSLSKSETESYITSLSPDQKNSFMNLGEAEAIMMEPKDVLWRFVGNKGFPLFSDCWIDPPTMTHLMSIFSSWGDYRDATKKNVVRDNLAILYKWNQLDYRFQITFTKPVMAFKGQIKFQNYFFKKNDERFEAYKDLVEKAIEYRVGGLTQYVIPEFKGITNEKGFAYAEKTHFASL